MACVTKIIISFNTAVSVHLTVFSSGIIPKSCIYCSLTIWVKFFCCVVYFGIDQFVKFVTLKLSLFCSVYCQSVLLENTFYNSHRQFTLHFFTNATILFSLFSPIITSDKPNSISIHYNSCQSMNILKLYACGLMHVEFTLKIEKLLIHKWHRK